MPGLRPLGNRRSSTPRFGTSPAGRQGRFGSGSSRTPQSLDPCDNREAAFRPSRSEDVNHWAPDISRLMENPGRIGNTFSGTGLTLLGKRQTMDQTEKLADEARKGSRE